MRNIETPDKMHLGRLIEELRYGKYVIPNFQREFTWEPWDVAELLRSIFEDYYIGTLLFWKASRENQKILSCEPIYGFSGQPNPEHIVLDGQQRLASLYYAFFAPDKVFPKRKSKFHFFINVQELVNENYDNAIYYEWLTHYVTSLLNNREEQFKNHIFPLKIIGEQPRSRFEWTQGYKEYWQRQHKPEFVSIAEKFDHELEELINSYDISFIELERDIEVAKVCDIFTRVNSTGVELSIFDLLNAMLVPQNIYLKDMWHQVADEFSIVKEERMRLYLLQAMSIIKQDYCSPKYLYHLVPGAKKKIKSENGILQNKVLIKNEEEFIQLWDQVIEQIKKTTKTLTNQRDYGAIQPKYLPYPTMIPILSVLQNEQESDRYPNKSVIQDKIKRWYWSSVFSKNYSSSVETQMARDYKEMKIWFKDDKQIPSSVKRLYSEIDSLDLKQETQANSAIYKAIFNILIINGAPDFASYQLPEYSQLEDHHIVPRSWGRKHNLEVIDSILNRTPVSDSTNYRVINSQLPSCYLKKIFRDNTEPNAYRLLANHLISPKASDILLRKKFGPTDFEEFLDERQKTIIQEIKKMLKIPQQTDLGFITPQTPYTNRLQFELILKSSEAFIYWIDKYFSKAGLDMLATVLNAEDRPSIKTIKILISSDKADRKLRSQFIDFNQEVHHCKIKSEMRVITNKSIINQLHDRWILTKYKNYNIPSTDTIARGQFSEIKETTNKPPFSQWWKEGLDIVTQWEQISKQKN